MMSVFQLQNPNGTLVKRATITEYPDGRAWLFVQTVYANDGVGLTSLLAAKMHFGREFQSKGKWKRI